MLKEHDFTRRKPYFTPRSGISHPQSGYFTVGALQNAGNPVIPSQCEHWRGNPSQWEGKTDCHSPFGASQ